MGTRHLTIVVSDGEYKVAQYGQWDGYPTGQGKTVVKFIMENLLNTEKFNSFKKNLKACKFISKNEIETKLNDCNSGFMTLDEEKKFDAIMPELSRNTGAKILEIINDRPLELKNSICFADDSLFCEWAWLINLDNKTLEVYEGFNKSPLEQGERFYRSQSDSDGYYPIRCLKIYKFDELTPTSMKELEESIND